MEEALYLGLDAGSTTVKLALVFLFLDNKEEEPAAAEPAAQTEVPARQKRCV